VHHDVVTIGQQVPDLDLHAGRRDPRGADRGEPLRLGRGGGIRAVVDEVVAEERGQRVDVARFDQPGQSALDDVPVLDGHGRKCFPGPFRCR
jgi:hypothetical protein